MARIKSLSGLLFVFVLSSCATHTSDQGKADSPGKESTSVPIPRVNDVQSRLKTQEREEELSWAKAQSENTLEAYRAFIEKYRTSRFFLKAVSKIIELEEKQLQEIIKANAEGPVRRLMSKLISKDPVERYTAVIEVKKLGEEAYPTIPFLVALLDDFREVKYQQDNFYVAIEVREQVITTLASMGEPAVEPLINALRDSFFSCYSDNTSTYYLGDWIQDGASKALIRIGDPSIQPLIDLIDSSQSSVRMKAQASLKEITGQDFGYDRSKWQSWWTQKKTSF
ncbi:MAG: HEAT repeat domain-containing protein [Phycisphaerales bacterium]|nr:MAG: HEAT repeat domain-containing protein [Phycisphaerales bacterium]